MLSHVAIILGNAVGHRGGGEAARYSVRVGDRIPSPVAGLRGGCPAVIGIGQWFVRMQEDSRQ